MFNQNPFMYGGAMSGPGMGLAGNILKRGINWEGLLTNTQKTLNVINQALPIYNQVKPMFKNVRTMFRVIGELNRTNDTSSIAATTASTTPVSTTVVETNGPKFFA